MVGALESAPVLLLAADHEGRRGEKLEVVGDQRRGPVGIRQPAVRFPQARFAYASRPASTPPAGSARPRIDPDDAHERRSIPAPYQLLDVEATTAIRTMKTIQSRKNAQPTAIMIQSIDFIGAFSAAPFVAARWASFSRDCTIGYE